MKKLVVILVVLLATQLGYGQKKNGVVYNEHPGIQKTEALWQALIKGDKVTFKSFFADSAVVIYNGNWNSQPIADYINGMDWWSKNFTNLTVDDDKPAFPDAIEYEKGGVWVQDWMRLKGTHTVTGIQLDLPVHDLYSFNKDGKITSFHLYFNNDVLQDIRNSQTTRENGTIYINHPYIATVRKLVGAFCAKDLDVMSSYFAENVRFHNASMIRGEWKDWAKQKADWAEYHKKYTDISMKEIGYPDCLHYALGDEYVVLSWWNISAKDVETGKKVKYSIMLTHTFNNDGKVVEDTSYDISARVTK